MAYRTVCCLVGLRRRAVGLRRRVAEHAGAASACAEKFQT